MKGKKERGTKEAREKKKVRESEICEKAAYYIVKDISLLA